MIDGSNGYRVDMVGSDSVLDGFTLIGNNSTVSIPIQWRNADSNTGNTGMVVKNCTIRNGYLYVLQNNVGHAGTISNNNFDDAQIYAEVIKNSTISYNSFYSGPTKRPVQIIYGTSNVIEENNISSGIAGVIFLGNHAISAARKSSNGNTVRNNIISGVSEESISFDVHGNDLTETTVRDYDTVSSTSGTNQVVLTDADWYGSTAFNSGQYYLGFVSGALLGEYYQITAHSNATFTLAGMTAPLLATVAAGDGVWIGLPMFGNTVSGNSIVMPNTSTATGIMLWGLSFGNAIISNVINTLTSNRPGIRCASLDGLVSGQITVGGSGSGIGRAPCDSNTITGNILFRNSISLEPRDYSGGTMYSIKGNTVSGNTKYVPLPNKRSRQ